MAEKRLRAVSELVSASLLVLIAITVGSIVALMILGNLQSGLQSLSQENLRAEIEAKEALSIDAAYIDPNGVLHVVVSTGGFPVTLQAVYINNTLWSCTAGYDAVSGPVQGFTIPPYTLAVVSCNVGLPPIAYVKIVYPGGELFAVASPVS